MVDPRRLGPGGGPPRRWSPAGGARPRRGAGHRAGPSERATAEDARPAAAAGDAGSTAPRGFCERVLRRIPVRVLTAPTSRSRDELTVPPRRSSKRAFDLVVATALLVLAAPLMLVVAVLIKLDSKGPGVLPAGAGGSERQGVPALEVPQHAAPTRRRTARSGPSTNDDRVTRVGRFIRKTRIDEIPQVFNVLCGDMSFVGPRPERPVFVDAARRSRSPTTGCARR